MRLSELIGAIVEDERGHAVGEVVDVRMIRDGPMLGTFGAAFRVHGFLVGRRSLGFRLGFGRADVRGPAALEALFSRLARSARYVEWGRVRSVEPGHLRIAGAADELGPPPPLRG